MKKIFLPLLLSLTSLFVKANNAADTVIFPFGENTGYYGAQFSDQQVYDLMYAGGARASRPVFTLQAYLQYGISAYAARFNYPYQTKGMRNNVMTLTVDPYGGNYTGQSTRMTAGGKQSLVPASLNLPVFNSDSSINTNNLWAKFVADVYNATQGSFQTYEAYNEPDINNDYVASQYDSSNGNYNTWAARPPTPDELINVYDSLSTEVRIQQITWQVIHHLSHNTVRVATGGISLRYWWRQALKAGIGPYVDVLSMHMYPYYYWTYWTNQSPAGAGNQRYSDMLLEANDSLYNGMTVISGQNGFPTNAPHMITETNTPRWNYDNNTVASNPGTQNKRVGNDHIQRNYALKGIADYWRKGFSPIIWFQTGEAADSPTVSATEFDAEGMYKNLTKATPGNATFTQSGTAIQTMQRLCGNYTIDPTQPTFASGVDGILLDSGTYRIYMLWAKTYLDLNETSSGTYTLPAGKTYKEYIWDGSSPGTVSGTINLIGDPYILVQQPPSSGTANAGTNQTITLPVSTASLNGSGSTNVVSSLWKLVTGPNTPTIVNPTSLTTNVTGLVAGVYTFRIVINTNVDSATVQVTVNPVISSCTCLPGGVAMNFFFKSKHGPSDEEDMVDTLPTCIAPVVNAGNPQTIISNSIILSGSATANNNSTIVSYNWIQVSGSTATIVSSNSQNTIINFPSSGVYVFLLKATDGCGSYASSSVTITVNLPVIPPPTVNAGVNQTITLPVSSVSLIGSASDASNSKITYTWSLTNGSTQVQIASINSPTTTVTGLTVAGTYTFKLTASSINGTTSSVVTITVLPAPVVSTDSIIIAPVVKGSANLTFSVYTVEIGTLSITESMYPVNNYSVHTISVNKPNKGTISITMKNLYLGTGSYILTGKIGTKTFTKLFKVAW